MEASISGRVRSRSGFPWTMAALLMRTVGGPSWDLVSNYFSKNVARE